MKLMEEIISEGVVGVVATPSTEPIVLGGGGGSFSQLLFSDEADNDGQLIIATNSNRNLDHAAGCFNFAAPPTFSTSEKPPTMLSFGDCNNNNNNHRNMGFNGRGELGFADEIISKTAPKSVNVTCSSPYSTADSSSTSSTAKNNASVPKSNRKRNGCDEINQPVVQSSTSNGPGGRVRSQRNCKKTRSENSAIGGHAKVRKEKLGERIASLQQLVSPFGKTDTASVLHEAMGYIKFLQEQIQVLSSPYLQRSPLETSKPLLPQDNEEIGEGESEMNYLRSRGLCLVPVEYTLHVADSNGADFWSPATINDGSSDH